MSNISPSDQRIIVDIPEIKIDNSINIIKLVGMKAGTREGAY
jgi:hypothetical protein